MELQRFLNASSDKQEVDQSVNNENTLLRFDTVSSVADLL